MAEKGREKLNITKDARQLANDLGISDHILLSFSKRVMGGKQITEEDIEKHKEILVASSKGFLGDGDEPQEDGDEPQEIRPRPQFLKGYAKASLEWDNFRRTQDLKSLREAARILEESHRLLQADEDFWAQLRSLPDRLETEDQKAEVEKLLEDFDTFLAFEEQLLVEVAQLPRQEVVRLLDDVNDAVRDRDRALRMVRSRADMDAIENLRDRSRDLQEALRTIQDDISAFLDSNETEHVATPRRYRWVNGVRKSLLFIGGAALVSYNLYFLDTGSPETPSVISGAQAMIQQFPEDLLEKMKKGVRNVGEKALDAGRNLWGRYRS